MVYTRKYVGNYSRPRYYRGGTPYRRRYGSNRYRRAVDKHGVARSTRNMGTYLKAEVKKVVKDQMSRVIETKQAAREFTSLALYYPADGFFGSNNVVPLSFTGSDAISLVQGAGDGFRNGNKVQVKKLTWGFVLRARQGDGATNPLPRPLNVRIVLFYNRESPTSKPTSVASDFFQIGNGTDSITGQLADMVAPINEDQYHMLGEKHFKLGLADFSSTPSGSSFAGWANNDYKLSEVVEWDLTPLIPKLVRFEDNDPVARSRGLWAVVMLAPADGGVGASNTIPAQMSYWIKAKYTDA